MRPLILVAASGLAREAAAAATASGTYDVLGFVDDNVELHGETFEGVKVLGGVAELADHPDAHVVICAGKGSSRAAIAQRLLEYGVDDQRYATVVHPSVSVPESCSIGAGSIVLAQVALTAAVTVGQHCVVMPNVTLTHDNVLNDYVTIAANVALGGWVNVGSYSYLGMSSSVRERVVIGSSVTVGMGAVVLNDVPEGMTMIGNPARSITRRST